MTDDLGAATRSAVGDGLVLGLSVVTGLLLVVSSFRPGLGGGLLALLAVLALTAAATWTAIVPPAASPARRVVGGVGVVTALAAVVATAAYLWALAVPATALSAGLRGPGGSRPRLLGLGAVALGAGAVLVARLR